MLYTESYKINRMKSKLARILELQTFNFFWTAYQDWSTEDKKFNDEIDTLENELTTNSKLIKKGDPVLFIESIKCKGRLKGCNFIFLEENYALQGVAITIKITK